MLYDHAAPEATLVSKSPNGRPGDWFSNAPVLSPDGRTIAFGSGASNLTAFSPPYPRPQIYAQTRDSHGRLRTKLLATGGGAWLRGMSSDGRFVAVATVAGYSMVDRLIGSLATVVRLEEVGKDPYINPIKAALSGDGGLLAFDAPRAAVIANNRSDLVTFSSATSCRCIRSRPATRRTSPKTA